MKNIFLLLILFLLPTQAMEVTFFNIGQGNCTLVTYPDKKSMLVDAGFSKAPAGDAQCNTVVQEIISKIKAKTPDKKLFVVASHADKDHINLLTRICDPLLNAKFNIEFLLGGGPSFYKGVDAKKLLEFLKLHKKNCKKTFASDILGDDRATQFKALVPSYCKVLAAVISPGTKKKLDPNDTSIVLQVTDRARSVLLPGDATGKVTESIMESNRFSLLSTVYELSHHGAETHNCTTLPLLLAINPRIITLSTGLSAGNLNHPRFDSIKTSLEYFVKRNRTHVEPHMLTYQDVNGIPSFKEAEDDRRFKVVALNDDGFCTAQTTFPIYHTVDSGNITFNKTGISASNALSTNEERGIGVLKSIQTSRFGTIRTLLFNAMEIESAQLQTYFTKLPESLEYFDLRNNNIGHFGIKHLITLYKNHGNSLIVKLADNREVTKKALTTICNKKDIKAITTAHITLLTFSKKGLAKSTIESLELSPENGNTPFQHVQAKKYAHKSSPKSKHALKTKLEAVNDDQEELVYELSYDKNNLYVEPSNDTQEGSYEWPSITDICLLNDKQQRVAGITTKEHSTIFDFSTSKYKDLDGHFRYTNPNKPWKTLGKEFWSLDTPGTSYYHERTPFSKNGEFVMTISDKNKCINIYKMDPLVFDPDYVKLHKTIEESELKDEFKHSIADIKRVAFTDNDHSIKINFTDKSPPVEIRYILDPDTL